MKNLLKLLFVFTLVFNSCSKDNNDDIVTPTQNDASETLKSNLVNYGRSVASTNQDQSYLDDCADCFVLDYPLAVIVDGEEVVVNSSDELEEIEEYQGYVFPITGVIASEQTTINNFEEFLAALQACFGPFDVPNDDPEDPTNDDNCFSLVFPVDAIDCDGNEIVLNSEEDLFTNCIADLVFPLTVTLADGSESVINNDEEFDDLYNDCYGIDDCEDCDSVCFEITFPMSFADESGNVSTANNEEELADLLENSDEGITIVYPINVVLEDGSTQAINSDEEFEALFESCI